jgi:hypothetical protein
MTTAAAYYVEDLVLFGRRLGINTAQLEEYTTIAGSTISFRTVSVVRSASAVPRQMT